MSSSDHAPVAVEAFCGAGGMSLGLTKAGFRMAAAFDMNVRAIETYRANLGEHGFVGDIRNVKGSSLLKTAKLKAGDISLVAGGPPCQGFSVQRREGHDDPRNSLPGEFLRLIRELSPAFFLFENVPGIKGRHGEAILNAFVEDATAAGYVCHAQTLDSSDFGIPQVRRRLFIVGERSVDGETWFTFPDHSTAAAVTVRTALAGLPKPPADLSEHPDFPHHKQTRLSALNVKRISLVPQGGGMEDLPPELRAPCHREGADKIGHRYVYGRLHWDRPAATITARFDSFTRGRFGHPVENRNITLREGARLQTFPDSYVFSGNQEEIAAQIGNAVPPDLAKQIGLAILDALDRRRRNEPARASVKSKTLFAV